MNAKEDKGSRKMSTHILGEDAYDRNGTLLLKKGTIVTDDIIEKLQYIKWWDFDDKTLTEYAKYITDPEKFISEVLKK